MSNRSSGFDFADRGQQGPPLDQHPDLDFNRGNTPTHLQRNKTERRRLQGLQRSLTTTSSTAKVPFEAKTWKEKYEIWMINDGGRQMFFAVFIFLHLLVGVFGVFHYQMKDNSEGARATFGFTFRTCSTNTKSSNFSLYCSHRSYRRPHPSCRRYLHSFARLPKFRLTPSTITTQRYHSL